ncbi:ISNCY family transposase, partial [Aliivibrio fischeri]|nr:ISNCY family transposase [Aliivibrio fischeri]
MIYDYPDGNIDIKYLGNSLEFAAFDHLEVIRQGDIVESKRLREVLKFAMSEQERLDNEGHRERRKSDPPRRQEQQRQMRMNLAVINSMKKEIVI